MSTDSDLIRLSLDRPDVFGELYARHASTVYRYAASRVGKEAADDVLSNTFLAAFERRRRYRFEHSSALPWLLGFATIALRQHRRDERRHFTVAPEASGEQEVGFGSVEDPMPHAAALAEVMVAVGRLSAKDRSALLLHVSTDLSYSDVARALGIPIGTVRSRINRARRILRLATGWGTAPEEEEHDGRAALAPLRDEPST